MVADLVQQQTMMHLACEMSWVRNLLEEMQCIKGLHDVFG
jgi:hypothetical protein